jgi:hypothetical protein
MILLHKCFPRCIKKRREENKGKVEASTQKQDASKQQPLSDFFSQNELSVLGTLASRVRVIIDDKLPPTLHGTSRVTDGIPLAIVNER